MSSYCPRRPTGPPHWGGQTHRADDATVVDLDGLGAHHGSAIPEGQSGAAGRGAAGPRCRSRKLSQRVIDGGGRRPRTCLGASPSREISTDDRDAARWSRHRGTVLPPAETGRRGPRRSIRSLRARRVREVFMVATVMRVPSTSAKSPFLMSRYGYGAGSGERDGEVRRRFPKERGSRLLKLVQDLQNVSVPT